MFRSGSLLTAVAAPAAFFVLFTLAPRHAAAEINMADSVEWMTADADRVVRGVVTRVTTTRGRGQVRWFRVTFKVRETLKGAKRATVRFTMRHIWGSTPLKWKYNRVELLVYLVASRRRAKEDRRYLLEAFTLRRSTGVIGAVVRLTGPKTDPMYNMRFQHLTRRAQMLQAARQAAKVRAAKGRPVRHTIDLPFNTPAFKALYGGSSVWFYVPADGRLERLALAWIKSTSVNRRVEGIKALSHFKSRKNIRLLRRMLADKGSWTQTSGTLRTRVYAVRQAAYKTLKRWRITVRRPLIRVRLP